MAFLLDPLQATAVEIQVRLNSSRLRSVEVIDIYLKQIEEYNGYLKAVITTAPRSSLIEHAEELDKERANGKIRGPLHGIPILVKDNVATHTSLGMDTTAGSFALSGSRPIASAEIIDRLTNAGAIILAKANLSELSFWKSTGLDCGWSAVGGQTQSPYVDGGYKLNDTFGGHSSIGGSSSGSAAGVAAGFAPFSIGTETSGSLVMPATRAALYTMKPTIGLVSQDGIVPISAICDSAGGMTKNVQDLANLMDVLVDRSKATRFPEGGYNSVLQKTWKGLKIGAINPEEWRIEENICRPNEGATKQQLSEIRAAYKKIAALADYFHEDVSIVSKSELEFEGKHSIYDVMQSDFKETFEKYLTQLESSPVRTMEEMVEFNKQHADKELPERNPSQDKLIKALTDSMDPKLRARVMAHVRNTSRDQGIDKTLQEYDIDAIIGPGDSTLYALVAAAGYPIATLPLSYLDFNGRAFGLVALTSAHREDILFRIQSAWEATFPPRIPPKHLQG
ncbi:MAG: hypothetical protein M1827_001006 [Pycnora praestabilis]|nr:MAG: hypothetical protein M1827_001006 [Pycnora praestabilis]